MLTLLSGPWQHIALSSICKTETNRSAFAYTVKNGIRACRGSMRKANNLALHLGRPFVLGAAVESFGLAAEASLALKLGSLALVTGSLGCMTAGSFATMAALAALGCSCCHCSSDRVGRPVCFLVGRLLSAPIEASQATTSFLQATMLLLVCTGLQGTFLLLPFVTQMVTTML